MKRASYRDGVDWIAHNDSGADDGALDAVTVAELVTACMLADIFDVPRDKVGRDIVARRLKLRKV